MSHVVLKLSGEYYTVFMGSLHVKPRALFVSMAFAEFSDRVRRALTDLCQVEEVLEAFPTEMPVAIVVVACSSPRDLSPPRGPLTVLVPRVPYLLVFPDGVNDASDPLLARIAGHLIETETTFRITNLEQFRRNLGLLLPSFTQDFTDIVSSPSSLPRYNIVSGDSLALNDEVKVDAVLTEPSSLPPEFSITFDPSLSPDQIRATLTALAGYYRACGGVGLSVEFESQETVAEEVHA